MNTTPEPQGVAPLEPLWSDNRIAANMEDAGAYLDSYIGEKVWPIFRQARDDYEADRQQRAAEFASRDERIATLTSDLTNALAEVIEWTTSYRHGSEEEFWARLNYKLLTGLEFGGAELIERGYGSEADNE